TPAELGSAATLLSRFRERGLRLVTAESCTGGLLAAALTAVAGASDVFDRGFVTYSNAAKAAMLGVPDALIASEGAMSEAVARTMAKGAIAASGADLAIAVTGVAGPDGGSAAKPVGLVWLAAAHRDGLVLAEQHRFPGNRAEVRRASVAAGLKLLARLIEERA
ncbi:MAG: CinA family protein, partial [Acetobacteraceae bacterium]